MEHFHKNPRKISDRQAKELAKSLDELGDLSGLIKDINTDEIIGGNQRFDYFEKHGYEINIVNRYDEPTAVGTVADGFIQCNGQNFAYREVDWTPEQCDRACIAANKMGGDWDYSLFTEAFEIDALKDGGFTEHELMDIVPEMFTIDDGDGLLPTLEPEKSNDLEQITFTLHKEQAELVRAAVKLALERGFVETHPENENKNGNAIATICERFYERAAVEDGENEPAVTAVVQPDDEFVVDPESQY